LATQAEVEVVVRDRLGALLTEAAAITGDPNKPNVEQCIGWAVRMLGYPTTSITVVEDSEVGAVTTAKLDALLDLAELRTLESIVTNFTQVNLSTGPVTEALGDLAKRATELAKQKRANAALQWGAYLATPLDPTTDKRKAKLRTL
jgi:hypothetical protein